MDLKLEQKRYRVYMDESYKHEASEGKSRDIWRYYELRGPRSKVYPYSESQLALYINYSETIYRKFKYDGWKIHQDGDDEVVWLLPNKDLDLAASIGKVYRRRILSEQQKKKLLEMSVAHSPFRKPTPSVGISGGIKVGVKHDK